MKDEERTRNEASGVKDECEGMREMIHGFILHPFFILHPLITYAYTYCYLEISF
jgi:hypothetical protein